MRRFLLASTALFSAAALTAGPPGAATRAEAAAREADTARVFFDFEVRAGERVSDFCQRTARTGLSCADLAARSSRAPFFAQAPALRRFEGLFVPGAYHVGVPARFANDKSAAADFILKELLGRAAERLHSSRTAQTDMILASIVQKESVSGQNYAEVASVFRNRLARNMNLGSCPTVEYALGYHRPFLTAGDISIDSPYNVYKRKGLPPTPIAFFSNDAWNAVQATPVTPYTFFVYDWTTKRLYFSKDYATHLRFAEAARNNFVRQFGEGALRQIHRNRFYE